MSKKRKLLKKFLTLGIFVFSIELSADTYSLSLSTSSTKSSGDLVLNLSNNTIHVPFEIRNFQPNGSGVQSTNISVGDGHDGVFDGSTYSNFSQNGDISGNTIRIDTDTYTDLQFTSFHLESGWTIEPVGSNPLIIYSQSTVQIDGTILCSGRDGQAGNADETIQVAGVNGRCGGASSGAGGYDNGGALVDASNGASGGASTAGGAGADSAGVAAGKGGGGGGGYSIVQAGQNPTAGVNPDGGSGGAAGTNFRNDEFTIVAGGSGGGGGAGFRTGTALENSSGASGGSGGGVVLIRAYGDITVSATGTILAVGGNGGSITGGLEAGAGGGGGGGSISLFSAANIVLNGAVNANEGTGGTSTGTGNGGKGGRGRTWVADVSGTASGGVVESPDTLLTQRGQIQSRNGNFSLITPSIDLRNSEPTLTSSSFTETMNGGTSSLEVASSLIESFTPTFKSIASLTDSDKNRYWKLRVNINQDASGNISSISVVDLVYTPKVEGEFNMVGACGLVKSSHDSNTSLPKFLFLFMMPLVLFFFLRRRKVPIYF